MVLTKSKGFDEYPSLQDAKKSLDSTNYTETKRPIKNLGVALSAGKGRMHFEMNVNGRLVSLCKGAIKHLSWYTGLNTRYYREYLGDKVLVDKMIQHSLNRRTGDVIVSHTDDVVLGIYPEDTVRLKPSEVFDICTARGGIEKLERMSVDVSGGFEFCFVTKTSKSPPKRVGEPSHAGLYVNANGSIQVASYVLTLSCVNGMRSARQWPTIAANENKQKLEENLIKLVDQKLVHSEQMLDTLMQLDDKVVDDPVSYMSILMKKLGMKPRAINRLTPRLVALPKPCTGYDLVQFVTSEANSSGKLGYQDYGFHVANSFEIERCGSCAHPIGVN